MGARGEEGLSSGPGVEMRPVCACLTVLSRGEEVGGWGADLASSEGMSEAGILKECSHLSRRERGGLVGQ